MEYKQTKIMTITMESAACRRRCFLGNDFWSLKRKKAATSSGIVFIFVSIPRAMMIRQIYQSLNFPYIQKRCRNPKERKNMRRIGVSLEIRDAGKIMAGKTARRREKKR